MSDDRADLAELMQRSKPRESHVLRHYLYFPKEADAEVVAGDLRRRGFRTDVRLGADNVNRLVLARHDIIPTEATVSAVRELMTALVRDYGGEYDGWEAEVK